MFGICGKKNRSLGETLGTEQGGKKVGSAWSDSYGYVANRALQTVIIVLVAALAIWGLNQISTVTIPVLLAVILASTFYPAIEKLKNIGAPTLVATITVLLAIIGVISGVIWLIVNAVIRQFDDLAEKTEDGVSRLAEFIKELPFDVSFNSEMATQLQEFGKEFLTSKQFGAGAIEGLSWVSNFATGFLLLVVILFFFLKDGPQIWEFLCRPLQGEKYQRAKRIGTNTVNTFGSYVRGTAIVAAVDAVGIGIGLFILQIPLALPLAVLVFVLSFVPIVGATIAGALAALVALVTHGPVSALIVIAIVIVVNQLEGNFLQPVVMGRALKLHSLAVLLALAIGTVLAGILGAILAAPIVAAIWGAIKVWEPGGKPARWAAERD